MPRPLPKGIPDLRVGFGYDLHPLALGRPLVLGGVRIPFERGLSGHSDADVVVHAVCDALLGACALGDLGSHFPDSDPAYKDISSLVLLGRVGELVRGLGFSVLNIDCTIVAEEPRLSPHYPEMVKNIASALLLERDRVSIKATSPEGLGFIGRREGMACYSVALVASGGR